MGSGAGRVLVWTQSCRGRGWATVLRATFVLAAGIAVSACSSSGPPTAFKQHSKEYFSEAQYGRASPRVVAAGPVPKGGGHTVVGASYRVAGKTYIPSDSPRYSETGYASWYGEAFHGRLTANGEVYDVNGLTAAHPTMPLPSYARVTNLENGRSMIVRVNDRGPFAKDRIIDLSSRVADMLDVKDQGTAKVKVAYVGPAEMDGRDEKMLLASYQGPSHRGDSSTMFAWLKPPHASSQAPVVMAASVAMPRLRPDDQATQAAFKAPVDIVPAFSASDQDLIGPLILRSGLVNSYASDATLSAAQVAVNDMAAAKSMAEPDLKAALVQAALRKGLHTDASSGAGTGQAVVQLGSFGDPANVARVAANFGRYGQIRTSQRQSGDHALTVVSVALNRSVDPGDVVTAAATAGLSGAFLIH